MFGFSGYQPLTQSTTAGTVVVPLRYVGSWTYQFDENYPSLLTGFVPQTAFAEVIQRCNGAMRGSFNGYRSFLGIYFMFLVMAICFTSFSYSDSYNWWWWWFIIWIAMTPSHGMLYRRSSARAIAAIQAELNMASARYPGTTWNLVANVYGRRAMFRAMHIEIGVNGTVVTAAPYAAQSYAPQPAYTGAPAGYGGGYAPVATAATPGAASDPYAPPGGGYAPAASGYAPAAGAYAPPSSGGYYGKV
mmetsp:Transcript_56492/g.156476  ORF Transcript_56492/g.156476 Transcript_56492/m.156476 type:complete len:246 (-) Transcript_56492:93-830(-)